MKIIYNSVFLEHDTGMHPENRKRLEIFGKLPEAEIENGEKYLSLFHAPKYINQVKKASQTSAHLDSDTVTSPGTYKAACLAVGATVAASQSDNFALVRPPGHHASPGSSSGFCIFNNIAIAVQKLVNEDKKVLIFDIDGHHGDGTESFFYQSDQVLYWSLHQAEAFPGKGHLNEIGSGPGKGYTINIPLPVGVGDDQYLEAVKTFLPVALAFKPDVVAVSAGFDTHQHDLLLSLRLSLNLYHQIGRLLADNFRHIFATLEGGYNIETLDKCVYNFIDGINGKPLRFKEEPTDTAFLAVEECQAVFAKLKANLEPCWKGIFK